MSFLLRLKHWQLFLLIVTLPIIFEVLLLRSLLTTNTFPMELFMFFPVVMVIMLTIFMGWYYQVGSKLHDKLPPNTGLNLNRFKFFLFTPLIYMVLLCIGMIFIFTDLRTGPPIWTFAIIVPLHLFSMFCMFYCLYFNAKSLKSVELQREALFEDYVGYFFLLWFFIVGIWIIQPKLNRLMAEDANI